MAPVKKEHKNIILAIQLKPRDNKCFLLCSSHSYSASDIQLMTMWIHLPNMTIAAICPNPGTFRGFPCMTELSPALSRSWTKFSEYCWILDTLKTSLNVAITSPLLLLGRWGGGGIRFGCFWCWTECSFHSPIGNNVAVVKMIWYRGGHEDIFNLEEQDKWAPFKLKHEFLLWCKSNPPWTLKLMKELWRSQSSHPAVLGRTSDL